MTIRAPRAIPARFEGFLLYLDDYGRQADAWFSDLVERRMQLDIRYESRYGGERFQAALHRDTARQALSRR